LIPFAEALRMGNTLILDGAMGTQLAARGGVMGPTANFECPSIVKSVHSDYRAAGAHILLTNTLTANRISLEHAGLADRLVEINAEGVRLCSEAAGGKCYVAGDMTSTGSFLEPLGDYTEEQFSECFEEQANVLAEAGVDLIIIETMTDVREAAVAVRAVKHATGLPVIASISFDAVADGFRTMMGDAVERAARALAEAGADVVGSNCGTIDPTEMSRVIAEMRSVTDAILAAQPNAGKPELAGGEVIFRLSCRAREAKLKSLFDLAVSGSCFAYVMPRSLATAMWEANQGGSPVPFDATANASMVSFMREMMEALAESRIGLMECYHSPIWESGPVEEVIRECGSVRVWSVHAPYGPAFDPSSPCEEVRSRATAAYLDAVEIAGRLGARVVVCHPGANVGSEMPKTKRLRLSAEAIAPVAERAGELGLTIAVEPLPKDEPGCDLDQVLWLVGRIGTPNVGVNLDVNHLFPPESLPDQIRRAAGRIANAHISDQDGQERHWLPFEGVLDWTAILAAFRENDYSGPLVYETHIQNAATCGEVCAAIVENYKLLMAL